MMVSYEAYLLAVSVISIQITLVGEFHSDLIFLLSSWTHGWTYFNKHHTDLRYRWFQVSLWHAMLFARSLSEISVVGCLSDRKNWRISKCIIIAGSLDHVFWANGGQPCFALCPTATWWDLWPLNIWNEFSSREIERPAAFDFGCKSCWFPFAASSEKFPTGWVSGWGWSPILPRAPLPSRAMSAPTAPSLSRYRLFHYFRCCKMLHLKYLTFSVSTA